MSGPATALPPDLAELMTVAVAWEKWLGFDGHGEPSYDPPLSLPCWLEEHSTTGGETAVRRADGTTVAPQFDLYFDGSDTDVQGFALWDRFTLPVVAGSTLSLQALAVSTHFGPPFDNQAPWIVRVMV